MGTDNKYRGMSSLSASKTWVPESVSESEDKVNKYPNCLGAGGGLGGLQPWLYVREGSQQPPGAELSEVKGFHESW